MPLASRALRGAAVALAVTGAFVSGALAGAAGSRQHAQEQPASLVDEVAARIAETAADPVSRQQLDSAAIEAMISKLGDRWAAYYAAGDYAQLSALLDGRYSGLGVWLRRGTDQLTYVASVLPDSPADAAGLRVGDLLVRVAGRSVAQRDLGEVVAALRGKAGSRVELVISRGGQSQELTLRRGDLAARDVTSDLVAEGVVRIRVAACTRGVGRQVADLLGKARSSHARGVVLDLRGDPGGLLDEGVEVASAFLDGGTVVSYTVRNSAPRVLQASGKGDTTTPLAVLVDGGTASAAEVVAGALQDRGRAVLVGTRSFGKGSVQQPIKLSDGSAIELTIGRYITPSGRSIDGVGLVPDIAVDPAASDAVFVRRAVDVLSGLVADAGDGAGSGRG